MTKLHPAIEKFLQATNAGDYLRFLEAFSADAVIVDWGRKFAGREEIDRWNQLENIGTQNQIRVTGSRMSGQDTVLDVDVSGRGFNGSGTFTITVVDGLISSLVIR